MLLMQSEGSQRDHLQGLRMTPTRLGSSETDLGKYRISEGNTDFLKWQMCVLGGSVPHCLSVSLSAPTVSKKHWEDIFPRH